MLCFSHCFTVFDLIHFIWYSYKVIFDYAPPRKEFKMKNFITPEFQNTFSWCPALLLQQIQGFQGSFLTNFQGFKGYSTPDFQGFRGFSSSSLLFSRISRKSVDNRRKVEISILQLLNPQLP